MSLARVMALPMSKCRLTPPFRVDDNQGFVMLRTTIIATALCCASSIAHVAAADLPSGYTCHDLRTKVAEYGATLILASARSRGFSEQEIAHIRGKCRV